MTTHYFKSSVRPDFNQTALDLIKVYEDTPGSTGPGCCPEAVAQVLRVTAGVLAKLQVPKTAIAAVLYEALSLEGLSEDDAAAKTKEVLEMD